jgi:hypothetical protein
MKITKKKTKKTVKKTRIDQTTKHEHKESLKREKDDKIVIEQIVFELFEIEIDEKNSDSYKQENVIIEESSDFIKKHKEFKSIKLIDRYELTTPEGESEVLAQIILKLYYDYGDRTMEEMFSRLSTYLRETTLNEDSMYAMYMPEGYYERFFKLDPDGETETLEEAIQQAKDGSYHYDLILKAEDDSNLNAYEKEEIGLMNELEFTYAGIYNYVLNIYGNSELCEIFKYYYFIS